MLLADDDLGLAERGDEIVLPFQMFFGAEPTALFALINPFAIS